jgi:glycosyltransferase involved in cell wall biosynthesis
MHQKDISKYKEMNIQSDVVFSNQADSYQFTEEYIDGNSVKMITTPYRGVGRNRNLGLLYSSGEILMFADDDLVYEDGYVEGVTAAFNSLRDADMIIFNCVSDLERNPSKIEKVSRVRLWNFMRYGTFGFVIKKESLLKSNIYFTQLFGGGSRYCAGEDNLFLRYILKMKLNVYSHPFIIAHIRDSESTWFRGYNEKYFFDNGAWLEISFPILKHLLVWYFVFKFAGRTSVSKFDILRLQYAGMKAFGKGENFAGSDNSNYEKDNNASGSRSRNLLRSCRFWPGSTASGRSSSTGRTGYDASVGLSRSPCEQRDRDRRG